MRNNLRDQIPALKNKYYFNYGGQGPLPKSSLEAIVKTWEIIHCTKIRCKFKECSFNREYLFRYDFTLLGNKSKRGRRAVNK